MWRSGVERIGLRGGLRLTLRGPRPSALSSAAGLPPSRLNVARWAGPHRVWTNQSTPTYDGHLRIIQTPPRSPKGTE